MLKNIKDDGGPDTCTNSSAVHGGNEDLTARSAEDIYHNGVSFNIRKYKVKATVAVQGADSTSNPTLRPPPTLVGHGRTVTPMPGQTKKKKKRD